GVAAMNALLAEPCAAPDQVVHGPLQLLDAVRDVGIRGRGICHEGEATASRVGRLIATLARGFVPFVRLLWLAPFPAVGAHMLLTPGRLAVGPLGCFGAGAGRLLGDTGSLVVVERR